MIAPAIAIVFSVAASAQEIVTPKNNPAPSRSHEIAWRFEAPPGPVRSMDARADYEVENIDCVPIDYERALGGVRLPPHHSVRLELRQATNGELSVIVYRDALQAEDYFHLGPCHWELRNVVVEFRSLDHRMGFLAALVAEQLSRNGVVAWHYLVDDFHKAPPPPMTAIHGEAKGFYPSGKAQFALVATVRSTRN